MNYTAFLVLIIIVAVALILIVMVQNPKGGGLSSSFGGGGTQSLGGVQSTNNFLDRATWTLAITMFSLILLANFSISRNEDSDFQVEETIEEAESNNLLLKNPAPVEKSNNISVDSLK